MSFTFKLLTAVRETTASGGTGAFAPGGPYLTLDGPVAGYFSFFSQLTPTTQYTHVCIRDDTEWEIRKATINSPTQMECFDLLESSTGTAISWPGTGKREVICSLAAIGIQDIVDGDNQTQGALVRTGTHTYAGKPFTGTTYVGFTDTKTPTLLTTAISGTGTATSLLHSGATASTAQRTMQGSIELAATSSIVSGYTGGGKHSLTGSGGEALGEIERLDSTNYRQRIREDGAMVRYVTGADLTAGDIGKTLVVRAGAGAYPKYALEDWRPIVARDTHASDWTALSVGIPIPADGTWDIEVLAHLAFDPGGAAKNCIVEAAIKEGAVQVAWSGNEGGNEVFFGPVDVQIHFHRLAAPNSATQTYTVDVYSTNDVTQTTISPRIHSLFARAIRRA